MEDQIRRAYAANPDEFSITEDGRLRDHRPGKEGLVYMIFVGEDELTYEEEQERRGSGGAYDMAGIDPMYEDAKRLTFQQINRLFPLSRKHREIEVIIKRYIKTAEKIETLIPENYRINHTSEAEKADYPQFISTFGEKLCITTKNPIMMYLAYLIRKKDGARNADRLDIDMYTRIKPSIKRILDPVNAQLSSEGVHSIIQPHDILVYLIILGDRYTHT